MIEEWSWAFIQSYLPQSAHYLIIERLLEVGLLHWDAMFLFLANLRTLKQYNDEGINVSPREQPPPVETRFDLSAPSVPYLSPRQRGNIQTSPAPATGIFLNLILKFQTKTSHGFGNMRYM